MGHSFFKQNGGAYPDWGDDAEFKPWRIFILVWKSSGEEGGGVVPLRVRELAAVNADVVAGVEVPEGSHAGEEGGAVAETASGKRKGMDGLERMSWEGREWVRVWSRSAGAGRGGGDYDTDTDTIADIARAALTDAAGRPGLVHVRVAGQPDESVTLKAGVRWPLEQLAEGMAFSSLPNGGDVSEAKAAETWKGRKVAQMWSRGHGGNKTLASGALYHACCNGDGLHLIRRLSCEFHYEKAAPVEVWVTCSGGTGEGNGEGKGEEGSVTNGGGTGASTGGRLLEVGVRCGALIDCISFTFTGAVVDVVEVVDYGDVRGGEARTPFRLEEGEYVTAVSGRGGDSLDAVCFHTSKGRASEMYGNPNGGSPFRLDAGGGGEEVIGVVRATQSGACCPKITGLVTRKKEEKEEKDVGAQGVQGAGEGGGQCVQTCDSQVDPRVAFRKRFDELVAGGMDPTAAATVALKAMQEANA